MRKVEIGIYCCLTADILTKVLQKCFPAKTNIKRISSETIWGMKLKFYRNVHNICLYKNCVFIAVAPVLSSLWQQSFHRLIMGKGKVGLYFDLNADILTKVKEMFLE